MTSFKVDENLPVEATTRLRDAGHDAMSVHDQEMIGATDNSLAIICREEERAIVTLDLDFADIRSYPPDEQFGIIVLRPHLQDKASVLELIDSLISKLDSEPLIGKLWIMTRTTIRIRG